MNLHKNISLLAGVIICALASNSFGGQTSTHNNLQGQINALQAQIAKLKKAQQQNQSWLDKAKAEKVNKLVNEVLEDSNTRSSFLTDGITAGYNGSHFFISSPDNNFKMQIEGRFNLRYMYTHRSAPADGDKNTQGFDIRKAEIAFKGHIFNPRVYYKLKLKASGAKVKFSDAYISYDINNNWSLRAGRFDGVFLREYDVSSKKQLAVERSSVTRYFTDHSTQGFMTHYTTDNWRVYGLFTNGPDQGSENYIASSKHYNWAVIGRGELLLLGNWKEFDGFPAWSNEPSGVLLGAAVQYDKGGFETGIYHPNIFKYSADISIKLKSGISLFTQFVGQHVSASSTAPSPNGDQLGVVGQIGTFVVPDKLDVFVRYEYANLRGAGVDNKHNTISAISNDRINVIALGGNYYLHKQNVKFSLDIVYALDPIDDSFSSTKTGLLPDMNRGEFAIRSQFQFLF